MPLILGWFRMAGTGRLNGSGFILIRVAAWIFLPPVTSVSVSMLFETLGVLGACIVAWRRSDSGHLKRSLKAKFKPEWRFHALPLKANQDHYHVQMTEGYISRLAAPTKRFQPTWQQPVRDTWRGFENTNEKPNPKDTPVAATLPDPKSQASHSMQQGGAAARECSRSPQKHINIKQSTPMHAVLRLTSTLALTKAGSKMLKEMEIASLEVLQLVDT